MICARCLRRASAKAPSATPRLHPSNSTYSPRTRFISSSHVRPQAQQLSANTAQTSNVQPSHNPATSTSAAQPFSTRDTPSPKTMGTPTTPSSSESPPPLPRSSVVAGTPLKGLNYFKNKDDPLALEDHEYPGWLWTVLDKKDTNVQEKGGMDPRLFSKSARSRRGANKRARKAALESAGSAEQQVPIYEQSVDLPADAGARGELTKGMREKRRKEIKEANFLRGM